MATIQKLRMRGFKSFPKLTEIPFEKGFSTVLGPNGSGKSNVMDAFCFVLGKISAKSMRAEKAANLVYNGGKKGSPAKEAQVDIFFNNNDKSFPLNDKEIKISRIVRQSGQSIYKINDKTKTRQEILELLNTAKIDPDGHNIILQGDIVGFMEMRPLDRRLLIEEIAGISVYEDKKEKALRELENVQSKLNEVEIILTEREANLRELKKDRDQAKRFKELEEKIKDNKATFLHMILKEKKEKKDDIEKQFKEQEDKIKDAENKLNEIRKNIDTKQEEINAINVELDEKGEKEQVNLRTQITDLKTDSVKNETRIETLKAELKKIEERNNQLKQNILEVNDKIKELRNKKKSLETELNEVSKKIGKQGFNKEDFERKLAELTSLKARQSNFTIFEDVAVKKVLSINGVYGTVASLGRAKQGYELPLEVAAGARNKSIVVDDDFIAEKCIEILKKDKLGVLTFLPLNKIKSYEINDEIKRLSKIQGVHGLAINLIEFESKFRNVFNYVYGSTLVVEDIGTARKVGIGRARMVSLEGDLTETSGAMIGGFRKVSFERRGLNKRILELEKDVNKLRNEITDPVSEKIREKTFEIRSEIRTIENQIDMLEDENERVEKILKEQERERADFKEELEDLMRVGKEKVSNLKNKEKDEKIFYGKFKAFVARRNKLQELIRDMENKIKEDTPKIKKLEERKNDVSINRAKVIAEMEGLEREFEEFKDGKIRKGVDLDSLKKEIGDFDKIIRSMGNVNLRALEIYEDLRKEYDKLLEKANKLKEEKEDVFKVISEIDLKKTESFMETFKKVAINFRAIFGSLSSKGEALLELENKEKPLEGGLDIKVRIKSNKFMDIHGLSGGEKTLAALAFIFAIQDFQPASFYLLDEVDAALDKHNSEKLSELIKKYSDKAQYIVISHNDAIISSADQIFGVSMQEGVSKIVSLRI